MKRSLMACAPLLAASWAQAQCELSDIDVQLTRWKWAEGCALSDCLVLKGVGVLKSRCQDGSTAIVRITGYDEAGMPVQTNETMPFMRELPAGQHPFSIDLWLDHNPDIEAIRLEVVDLYRFPR